MHPELLLGNYYLALFSGNANRHDVDPDNILDSDSFRQYLIEDLNVTQNRTRKDADKIIKVLIELAEGRGLKYNDSSYLRIRKSGDEVALQQIKSRVGTVCAQGRGFSTLRQFLDYDFDSILQEIKNFKLKYGFDPLRGWQFDHPVKKLQMYQKFLHLRIQNKIRQMHR